MLTPQQKELIQFLTPVASALVAFAAVFVALRLGRLQRKIQEGPRKIQEAQLKNSLYDRRFEVYQDSGEYLARIMRKNGDLDSADLQWYVPVLEKSDLLFGAEVATYLRELQDKAGNIYVKSKEAKHKEVMEQFSGTEDHLAVIEMMKDFCGPMLERRKALFRPYLKLEG